MNVRQPTQSSDARLWLVAIVSALALNSLILLGLAFMVIHSLIFKVPEPSAEVPPEETVVTIMPVEAVEEPPVAEKEAKRFARTSDDQLGPAAEDSRFIGERDTQAASDANPVPDGPDLPSQAGEAARDREMETTESRYQDGDLAHERVASPDNSQPTPMVQEEQQEVMEKSEASGTEEPMPVKDDPAPRAETLAETPFPVDRPASPEMIDQDPKPSPEKIRERADEKEREEVAEKIKPSPPSKPGNAADPGFRGHQRRTELKGSISRRGRAALDVEAGPLGRYHAALSRAIEKSWQRKVIQNRDYITPGVIRIRVVLDEKGRVRSVGTVEEFGIGVIQRGFTHSAIREADLPKMPQEVRQDLGGEPLELLYNFIF